MPFDRPTLSELRADAQADIAASLKGSDPLLKYAVLRILAITLAGQANQHYGYLDWVAKQAVPYTSTDEFLYAWGALKNVFLKPATRAGDVAIGAAGSVTFSNSTPGETIPAGSLLVRGDGFEYTTNADATIDGAGNATVGGTAILVGANGNCPVGTKLTLGVSIAGIQSDGVATVAFTGGADVESQSEFRSRMLQVYQTPPQGGAQADYVAWALAVPGVTRAWCAPLAMGAGTVTVFFMMDDVRSAFGGFPQGTNGVATLETRAAPATGDQLLVANTIFPKRPVTALVYASAPIAAPVAFTIDGIADLAVRAAIGQAIDDVFLKKGSPGGTVDQVTGLAGGTTNLLDIEAAMAAVPGAEGAVLTSPAANIVAAAGNLSTRGAITWT